MLLSQVISKDIQLKAKSAHQYIGICPFHNDSEASLNVHDSKNLYKCFACGKGGRGAVSYIIATRKVSKLQAENLLKTKYDALETTLIKEKEEITYLLPAQKYIKPTFEHYIYGKPTNIYEYRNLQNQLVGYTCRYTIENNSKIVLPYNYILFKNNPEWCFKGFKALSLPYKAELLTLYPDKTVCIVEGEKAADWGNKSSQVFIFLAWVGGANAVNNVNWSCLKNRDVILIPDHDKLAKFENGELKPIELRPGNSAMLNIANKITRIASKIEFVVIPEEYSHKWDIADRNWSKGDLKYWINKYKKNYYENIF